MTIHIACIVMQAHGDAAVVTARHRNGFGPVTITSPSAVTGWSPVFEIRKPWWISVSPSASIALTGQYLVADSSIAAAHRRLVTPGPSPRGRGRSG